MAPKRAHVLVVEDDPDLRHFYRQVLGLAGFTVIAVEDGFDALRFIDSELPDLIVLDMALPRLGGRDVQKELAAHAETCRIPTVVVTGMDTRELDDLAVTCVLRKPVSADVLIQAVMDCLAGVRATPGRIRPSSHRLAEDRRAMRRCPSCGIDAVTRETVVKGAVVTRTWRCMFCDSRWAERREAS